jgi:FixJ family two-component response regulator
MLAQAGYTVRLADSGDEGFRLAREGGFDVILSDMKMPGLSGLEVLRKLRDSRVDASFIIMTGFGTVDTAVEAMKLGAVDFLAKPVEAGVLREAVHKALARHASERARAGEREAYLARLGRLSAREREVMVHVVRGRLNKQIAADLDIALQTVKQHRSRVMEKMEVGSVADLVRACQAAGAIRGQASH